MHKCMHQLVCSLVDNDEMLECASLKCKEYLRKFAFNSNYMAPFVNSWPKKADFTVLPINNFKRHSTSQDCGHFAHHASQCVSVLSVSVRVVSYIYIYR